MRNFVGSSSVNGQVKLTAPSKAMQSQNASASLPSSANIGQPAPDLSRKMFQPPSLLLSAAPPTW
jgi:hypothetical protein